VLALIVDLNVRGVDTIDEAVAELGEIGRMEASGEAPSVEEALDDLLRERVDGVCPPCRSETLAVSAGLCGTTESVSLALSFDLTAAFGFASPLLLSTAFVLAATGGKFEGLERKCWKNLKMSGRRLEEACRGIGSSAWMRPQLFNRRVSRRTSS
jgi:hypothetical protein